MTKRMNEMNTIIEKLTAAARVGDWNKVIYWTAAARNKAAEIKAARKAYRAKTQAAPAAS